MLEENSFALFGRAHEKDMQAFVCELEKRFSIDLFNILIKMVLKGRAFVVVINKFFHPIRSHRTVGFGFGQNLGKNSPRGYFEIEPRRIEYMGKRACNSIIMQKYK